MAKKQRVKAFHFSGWYKATYDDYRALIGPHLDGNHFDFCGVTEVAGRTAGLAIRRLAHRSQGRGFIRSVLNNAQSESAIIWNNENWECIYTDFLLIQERDVAGPRGRVWVPVGIFRSRKDPKITGIYTAGHLLSDIEGKWHQNIPRILAYRRSVANWRRHISALRRQYKVDFILLSADVNLDFKKLWVRLWWRSAWPGMKPSLNVQSLRGSHGPRLIDVILGWRVKNLGQSVLNGREPFDHKPVSGSGRVMRRGQWPDYL